MDFDFAWCPACDRQIPSKPRKTKSMAPPPPPPPPSPKRSKGKTGGLVNGTGRLRHNGTIKASPAPPVEQNQAPLYCSDECQFADINAKRRSAPLDPMREESQQDDSHSPSVQQFLKMYNLPPLPEVPVFEPPSPQQELPWTSGIMMAGRLIDSLCPPPQKPYVGRYRPVEEPRKPTKGWNDGSHAWRDAVYSTNSRNIFDDRHPDIKPVKKSPAAYALRQSLSSSASSSASSGPSPAESEEMINNFSRSFVRQSSQSASYSAQRGESSSSVASSPSSTQSLPARRERSLVAKGAEGKLIVPNVTMRVSGGSSASLSSACSAPTASSRRSVRSPLSVTSEKVEKVEEPAVPRNESSTSTSTTKAKRPRKTMADTPRSWSYDNVLTYDAMPFIPKKVKKMEKQIIDGEEKEVEVEVEVYEERKQLFLFAPSVTPLTRISI